MSKITFLSNSDSTDETSPVELKRGWWEFVMYHNSGDSASVGIKCGTIGAGQEVTIGSGGSAIALTESDAVKMIYSFGRDFTVTRSSGTGNITVEAAHVRSLGSD